MIDTAPARTLTLASAPAVIQAGRAAGASAPGAGRRRAPLVGRAHELETLRIRILAPRVDIGGGARILFEHANRLHDRGHDVSVLANHPRPDWFDLRSAYRHVPVGMSLPDALDPCDLVVCGYWDQVPAARAAEVAPVVHFEQGDFHLFEELPDEVSARVRASLELADATTTVSARVATVLLERYGIRDVGVVHNAVDSGIFRSDGPRPGGGPYVLCVGWDGNEFKGMADVRRLWAALRAARPELELVWVTPRTPIEPMGRVVVGPAQPELATLFRGAAVYLCASHYESFPLPPLEAMASGAPVVTTANVGVLEYARDRENAIVVPIGDVTAMASAIGRILDDPTFAASLRAGGARTAASFSWDRIVDGLDTRYREVARRRLANDAGDTWERVLPSACAASPSGQARLEWALGATSAAEILVPVVRPAIEGHDIASWEVIARRPEGAGAARVHAPHRVAERGSLPYQAGIDALDAEDPQRALDIFTRALHETSDRAQAGALAKWVALSLFETGETESALALIASALPAFPDNPDLTYLAAVVGSLAGATVDLDAAGRNLHLIGEGRRYADWFVDPESRLQERVSQPAQAARTVV